jgi:hypothetical protein
VNGFDKLPGLQEVEVVGQFETRKNGQTHFLNSKISVGTASGKV